MNTASVQASSSRGNADYAKQTAIGLTLAVGLIAGWLSLHAYSMFVHRWTPLGIALAPFLIALQCWLNVGLFIVAHDCMHGSLAPFRPRLNRAIGRTCLALYAGFSYDRMIGKHFAHHRHSGTAEDPDFHADGPRDFWPWFIAFFRRYFGLRELVTLWALIALYVVVLRVDPVMPCCSGECRPSCRRSSSSTSARTCRIGMRTNRSAIGTTPAAAECLD
jgi:beta-carotene ketolase (CrtW type)